MSTPSSTHPSKPLTRNSNKKRPLSTSEEGATPVLTTRKRKSSCRNTEEEPKSKKMVDAQILEAINGIKTSVAMLEQQLRAAPTKADLGALVTEIRGVRESVIRNTDRIDTLFDLRKDDGERMSKKVDQLIADKLNKDLQQPAVLTTENQRNFLQCRRSVRLWPVRDSDDLEKSVKNFLATYLLRSQIPI